MPVRLCMLMAIVLVTAVDNLVIFVLRISSSYDAIAVLHTDMELHQHWVLRSWGCISTEIGGLKAECFVSLDAVMQHLHNPFLEKTGIPRLAERAYFVEMPYRFIPVELEQFGPNDPVTGVAYPIGQLVTSAEIKDDLRHNEYLICDTDQGKQHCLVRVKFKFTNSKTHFHSMLPLQLGVAHSALFKGVGQTNFHLLMLQSRCP
ncbi:Poly [ADP-ribose] polymerase [Echinococcus granulosus]|uniref:Poly [ADP-ribose] polymerase n=1 Tax=Echinococcus granulosus TaxID=6210 RepID=W6U8E5_ECHGR|nr:Poly [ADP-ribose] polymerase [Echinococcus granulosus]EUB54712.1 Poly [ADP-ribose] polymerase [Echinococcus granulosus]